MELKYKGLIRCAECNYTFKGRKERNKINYRCNRRLKYGKDKCNNNTMIEETLLTDMIKQQLDVINMCIDNVDIQSIIKEIIVSKDRIEIFFKNLTITSCYLDSKMGKLHFDTLNN